MEFKQLQARLGRNGQILVLGGVLMLVDSLFGWYGLSGDGASELKAMGYKTSSTAWGSGFGAWFSVLLVVAVAAIAMLAALGRLALAPLTVASLQLAGSLLAVVLVLLRWMTYQTASGGGSSVGALWGTYVGVLIAVVVAVFAYLDFTAKGGDIKNPAAAFQNGQAGPPADQGPAGQG